MPRLARQVDSTGGGVDPGGELDMQQLLAVAAEVQSQLVTAQQELADARVQGTAGGGLVTAVVSGTGELVDLTISADAIDPADPDDSAQTIADLVLAAFRDAQRAAEELRQQKLGPFAAGLGGLGGGGPGGLPGLGSIPGLGGGLPGLGDLPGLGGLPGMGGPGGPADPADSDGPGGDPTDGP
jgi:DNA-binding YbaB/EbfC family protein